MTLKLNFVVVQFGSKTISRRDDEFFINERDRDFLGAFFRFSDCQMSKKILTQTLRENDTRENNQHQDDRKRGGRRQPR